MTARRFEGPYGRAYDAVMSSQIALGALGSTLRSIPDLILDAYERIPDEPLLDVPCGAANALVHGHEAARSAKVVGVDLSPAMLERGRRRIEVLKPAFDIELIEANGLDLPFEAATFGAVLSINGLHCMPNHAAFLDEIARVARPGAALTMTTLVDAGTARSRAVNGGFRRAGVLPIPPPTVAALRAMLDDTGWTAVELLGGRGLVALRATRGDRAGG
jgi:ubiquinone/menaquinone biosynthesis C-methylase UbiE